MNLNNLVSPISSNKKRFEIDNKISEYLNEKKQNEKNEEVINEALNLASKESNYIGLNESLIKDKEKRDSLSVDDEIFDDNLKETLANLFGVIVYESLPIDLESKSKDSRSVIESASSIFKSLYENDTLIITQSPTYKKYAGSVVKHVENCSNRLTEEEIEGILSTLFSDHYIDLNNTITNIYDKTANAVRTETQIKEFRGEAYDQNYISTNSNYVHENFVPTLFRYLNENKVEEIIKSDKSNNLKREDILNISLAETLGYYTIMETLNTTKLVDFDLDKIKRRIKY